MRIALDIDDTIAATNLYWAELCIKKYGNNNGITPVEILNKYKYVKNMPFWKRNDIISSFFGTPNLWIDIPIIQKSNEVVTQLEDQLFCYITTRPSYLKEVTEKWLAQNKYPFKRLYMPDSQENTLEWKKETLLSIGSEVDCMIDDNMDFFNILYKSQ